jgi:hypothetical protein
VNKPAHKWIIHINTRKNLWAGWILNLGGKETLGGFLPTQNPLVFLRRDLAASQKYTLADQEQND